ncbi:MULTISPECIES: acyl carrier protein [Tsukamurella]|uniref:Acyl carrier protein n=1 Tax=Tsukamurella strandjordii TaxID=147577 RepID=A0AA90NQH4_9ACTN|nr:MULTISPECIES: acyl carrier protein [Tsukamurella]MDP0398824.1 acyl carrier protein [Tsukamurella strandjordii]GIZ99396.1 hypothetical protein TTY48_40080 [Tsukamurella sp. TY48]
MEQTLRSILGKYGKLAVDANSIATDDDLYALGMTSHASVAVMVAIEDEFDIEIPDRLLKKETFGSLGALTEMIDGLRA